MQEENQILPNWLFIIRRINVFPLIFLSITHLSQINESFFC